MASQEAASWLRCNQDRVETAAEASSGANLQNVAAGEAVLSQNSSGGVVSRRLGGPDRQNAPTGNSSARGVRKGSEAFGRRAEWCQIVPRPVVPGWPFFGSAGLARVLA